MTTDYYWSNGILQAQKTGDEYILFLYDENGAAYGLIVRNGTQEATYYYIFNLQGDIIGILDSSGNAVVNYTYNAWGELQSVTGSMAETLGQKNPLRYRGYYYDQETGFYYLQSRYYDPIVQRFLNADGYISTGQGILGNNMFAYCGNNPIVFKDSTGESLSPAFAQLAKDIRNSATRSEAIKKLHQIEPLVETSKQEEIAFKNAQSLTSIILQPYSATIGLAAGKTTAIEAATISGVGYLVTTPVNITLHWANPQLNTSQKWIMTGFELSVATIGVLGTYAIVNLWNPCGWIMAGIVIGYTLVTYCASNMICSSFYRRNGYN